MLSTIINGTNTLMIFSYKKYCIVLAHPSMSFIAGEASRFFLIGSIDLFIAMSNLHHSDDFVVHDRILFAKFCSQL
jgi:hypothetical protein